MEFINIKRTFYRVSDFISWQNNNSLIRYEYYKNIILSISYKITH